jgi:nitrate/nitrite transporter NarK
MSVWFHGKQVSLALGLCLSFPKLGSAMNSFVSPMVQAEYGSLGFTLFIGLLVVLFSWVCGIMLILLDKENSKRLAIYKQLGIKLKE